MNIGRAANLRSKIKEITTQLAWRIENTRGGSSLEITSDPWRKIHIIHIPDRGADWRDIEYLHELAHAVLAEKHHLLSTAYFTRSTRPEEYEELRNPFRCASDWYADWLLMQWCPEDELAEIVEHADYALRQDSREAFWLYSGALCVAEAVKYGGFKLHTVPRRYREAVNVLLAADPGKPSVTAKRDLINELAALTCRCRVLLTQEDGMDVWQIKK